MKQNDSLIKLGFYALGMSFTAMVAVGCAGTGTDVSTPAATDSIGEQQTVAQNSPTDETGREAEVTDPAARIAAVVKFAKEVELDESTPHDTETIPTNDQNLSSVATTDGAGSAATTATSDNELPQNYVFHFASDSVVLDDKAKIELKKHADYLMRHSETTVTVSGHSDIQGSSDYNIKLSRQRAEAVADTLKSHGVAEKQILISGHGEDVPVVDAENWRENRRVELEYMDDSMLSTR